MAGDTNSNIFINIDTAQAMAQLRALEKELTALNRALVTGTKTAAQAQAKYTQGLLHNVNATGQWTASTVRMSTASEQFATALDRSKLSLKEYFRYGMASTKTFGRVFGSEFDTVSKLVQKRVKTLQQQYVQLGRDASGAMNAVRFTPKNLNYRDVTTQLMMATQRQQIFNKLLDDGATKLLNFGKNTQWAGRQLMVGFTIPLMLFGSQAIRVFKEIETQTIRFKKVYGDIFTDPGQTELALKNIRALADEYTKYGVKVADTIKMAADAAAAGNSGKQLEQIVEQTNRLAVLGGVTQEKALETTIALKNAFQIGAEDLDETINFLNAVENQTVVALDDLTEAIPRVAPVVQQLGGDVKDLAFFMAAMQEGGISAAQGANALKSGLASLINPSNKAAAAALELGVNIRGIVEANQGNLSNIVVGFAKALEPLTDLQRTRIIEDIFGKFQFARISALLNNVTKEGTQAARVLQLANASVEELGILAERELGVQAESSMNKFVGAVERLKAVIAPIGEVFAKTLTPAIEFISRMAERFNKLPEGIKKGVAIILAVVGGLGPIFLMTFGLLANALANTMKGFNLLRKGYQNIAYGSSDAALKTQYLTQEELENISVTNALYSTHERLSAAYRLESTALGALIAQYTSATAAMRNFSVANPGLFIPGRGVPPIRRAGGGTVSGPGTATSDSIPAYLSDGEYVVNAKAVDTYGVETFDALNARKLAAGGPAMRDGIPRLFAGGWMSRIIQSMMPRTRFGVLQGADGFGISGFAGGARRSGVAPSLQPLPKTNLPKIPWIEDAKNPNNLIIRDPSSGQEFTIPKTSKAAYDRMYNDLVLQGKIQKRGNRPEMSPTEYLMYRLLKKHKQGKPLTAQQVLGQAGTAGKSRVRIQGASKGGAYSRWGRAVDKPKVRSLQRFFDSEKDHLRNVLPRETFDELEKSNLFVVSPSHIRGAGANRSSTDWSRDKILRDTSLVNFGLNYMTRGKRLSKATPHPTTQAEADKIISAIELLKAQGPLAPTLQGTLEALKYRKQTGFYGKYDPTDVGLELKSGGMIQRLAGGMVGIGMPTAFAKVQQGRMLAQQIDARVRSSRFREMAPTDFGVKMKDTSGHSFPIPGVGGIYRKPNGDLVFVKPVMDEKAALAEQRATIIARKAHGLNAPKQTIRTMIDPTDLTRKRRFLVLESPYDANLGKGGKEFTKDQYFKQLVASTLRGDKDLSPSNVFGGTLADVGTAGVFARASGKRDYSFNMPSMAEQAMTNLLGIKGGAKRAFAESTADMIRKMNPATYRKEMIKEIDAVLPRLKDTVKSFGLTGVEKILYERMITRLEAGRKVDWTKYHAIHSKVKPKKYATGVFSVPGPKGAGDVVPAMLSPGESVIPTEQTQKYQPLIRSIIADNVPGFVGGDPGIDDPWDRPSNVPKSRGDILADKMTARVADATTRSGVVGNIARRFANTVDRIVNAPEPTRATSTRPVPMPGFSDLKESVDKNTKAVQGGTDATDGSTKLAKQAAREQIALSRTQGPMGYLRGFGNVPTVDPETGARLTSAQRMNYRQNERMQRTNRLMGPSMVAGMAGSMAMMYGMSKPESFFGQNMNAIMGVTLLAGLLPLLNSPLKMMIAGVVSLIALYKLQGAQIKQAIVNGQNQGKAMMMTTENLEALGKITGTVSITQEEEMRRRARTTEITPVSMDFGKNLITNEDYGKQLKATFDKTVEQLGTGAAVESLSNQLATAVSQGVLTGTQAESIAVAITRDLKDARLEMAVRGRLIQLIGPNGENVLTDPLKVQLDIIASGQNMQNAAFQNLQNVIGQQRSGLAGIGGNEAKQLGIGAVPAAGAALYGIGAANVAMGAQAGGALSKVALGARALGLASKGAAVVPVAGWAAAILGTVIFGGIELGIRKFQQGQEKKAIGEAAGIFQAISSENLKASQQALDALNVEIGIAIQNLEAKKKAAKTAEERSQIEQRIIDLEEQRVSGAQKIRSAQGNILKTLADQYDQIGKETFFENILPGGPGRGALRQKFMESFDVGLQQKFKNNAVARAELTATTGMLEQKYGAQGDEITLQIKTLISSDVLTPREAGLVVANLSSDTKVAKKELEAMVTVLGTEGLQRLGTILTFLPKAKNRKNLQLYVQTAGKEKADEIMSSLEEIIKFPSYLGIDINLETQKNDIKDLARIGSEIADIRNAIPEGKLTKKLLIEMQEKAGGKGKNLTLDNAIAQWETISKLPRSLQFQALISIGTISQSDSFDKIINRELEAGFYKANPTLAMSFVDPKKEAAKKAALEEYKKDADNIAKATAEYWKQTAPEVWGNEVGDDSVVPPPPKETTGLEGGAKGSWLQDIGQRLKLVKESSFDALNTLKELRRFYGQKSQETVNPVLQNQKGALDAIRKSAKDAGIVLNEEFMSIIEGFSAEEFKQFAKDFLILGKGGRVKGLKEDFLIINAGLKSLAAGEITEKVDRENKTIQRQIDAYKILISEGYNQIEIQRILEDATMTAMIADQKFLSLSIEERTDLNNSIRETIRLRSQESLVEDDQQITNLQNQIKAFDILNEKGVKQEVILEILKNNAYVWAVVTNQGIDEIVTKITTLLDLMNKLKKSTESTFEDTMQTAIDRNLAALDLEAKILQNQFDRDTFKLKIDIQDAQEAVEAVNKTIQAEQDKIDAINLEIKYDKNFGDNILEDLKETISDAQRVIEEQFDRPIQALQDRSSILSNDLTLMDKAAEAINEKYDLQEKALKQISDINQDIINQQKQQISLADALTQGDISAAARAAQEMRTSAAEAASRGASGVLTAAREADLANIRSASGMTRKQIEQEQFNIGQRIYNLEQQRKINQAAIVKLEDELYKKQELREDKVRTIRVHEEEINRLRNNDLKTAQTRLDNLQAELDKKQKMLDAELAQIEAKKLQWESVQNALDKYKEALDIINNGPLATMLSIISQIADKFKSLTGKDLGINTGITLTPEMIAKDAAKEAVEAAAAAEDADALAAEAAAAAAAADAAALLAANSEAALAAEAAIAALEAESAKLTADLKSSNEKMRIAIIKKLEKDGKKVPNSLLNRGGGGTNTFKMAKGGFVNPQYRATGGMISIPRAEPAPAQKMNMGGLISYMSNGGMFKSLGTDTVPAMLTPGEFVMSRYAVENYGLDKMKAINNGTSDTESVYNYSVNVNVKSGSNPDEIARAVMTQIKQIDSQRIRGQRVS